MRKAADVARQFANVITATRQRLLAVPSKFAGQFVRLETVTETHKRWKAAAAWVAGGDDNKSLRPSRLRWFGDEDRLQCIRGGYSQGSC